VSLLEVVGEIGAHVLGGLLPGPSSLAGQAVMAFLAGAASLLASVYATHHLFGSGQPYSDPEWAFNWVVSAAVGGIFAFVLGLACWSKAEEGRAIPAVATILGLSAMLLFPGRLLLFA